MIVLLDGSDLKTSLANIANDVFSTMVGMTLELCEDTPEIHDPVTAMLSFRQPVGKALLLECDRELAFEITSRLMSLESPPSVVDDDVRDSISEMVNMIGGNFRTLFTERESLDTTPCLLSLSAMHLVEKEKPLASIWLKNSKGSLKLSVRADSLSGINLLINAPGASRPIAIDSLKNYCNDIQDSTAA